jgi:uncharacterized protein YprB with RNaseH-like and TPR domain
LSVNPTVFSRTKMADPKILFFDIESAGVNALKSDLGFVIVFGYKWGHEKKVHTIVSDKQDLKQFSDKKLLIKASKLFEEADILVGHFASIFDRRFIQGRLLINFLPPIPPVKMRDTCLIARSVANFSSNRLKHLGKILNLTNRKLENNWPTAWFKVMQGDLKYLRGLAKYCEGDVLALEELYMRLRPFDNPHPRIIQDRSKCGVCGGDIQYRGVTHIGELIYRRFQCKKCFHWGRERNCIKQ